MKLANVRWLVACLVSVVLLVAACSDSNGAADGDTSDSPTPAATTPPATTEPTPEPVELPALQDLLPTGTLLAAERVVDLATLPSASGDPAQQAQQIAEALAEQEPDNAEAQTTAEVLAVSESLPAVAYVSVTGYLDDSVAGDAYTLTFEPDGADGWTLTAATSRSICRRGVSDGLCS